ncbi:MAG: ARMT1-like domain-containing protein [Phycisphaeraceae bacterium]
MTRWTPSEDGVVFPLIGSIDDYEPHTIEMLDDAEARRYWLDVFRTHTAGLAERAALAAGNDEDAQARAAEFAAAFDAVLDRLESDPFTFGSLDIALLCTLRQHLLATQGFDDPFLPIKQKENADALALLPALLTELDALPEAERLRRLIAGVFAGNIFDFGASEAIKLYEAGQVDFHVTREQVAAKQWLVDHLAKLEARFAEHVHRRAVVFVDNAGADVVLGMIPLARYLLQRGTHVVLTANSKPALNDVIHDELEELIDQIAAFDAPIADALADGSLTLAPSGNALPVIDLTSVDAQLAAAAEDADLLVLEGMGRALETNYRHRFTCDTLKLAMIKEQHVADVLGGKLYDVVCHFDLAPE